MFKTTKKQKMNSCANSIEENLNFYIGVNIK